MGTRAIAGRFDRKIFHRGADYAAILVGEQLQTIGEVRRKVIVLCPVFRPSLSPLQVVVSREYCAKLDLLDGGGADNRNAGYAMKYSGAIRTFDIHLHGRRTTGEIAVI